ncbi:MAG: sulfatase-like hydrolase/transferase, partial [Planctomycetes bacterium]|nr:sulfatase-like hydrolase/transferase [Planctomycetota bacterium]
NVLRYSDDTLGAFFASIRDEPWFEKTLFVITADHVSGVRGGDLPMPERFRVPCLLLGPGIGAAVDPRTSSQLDILPTIVEELGWDAAYSGLGRSLLDEREPSNHGAMMVIGDDAVMRKEGPSWLVRNIKRRLISQGGEELDELELRLQANWQLALRLLADNRVFPGPESLDN